MAKTELVLPAMGEGIIEATITKWLVNEGDTVEEDQPLLEIATDKVDSEIPSPVNGVISAILIKEGAIAKVGSLLAEIETANEQDSKNDNKEKGEPLKTAINSTETDPENKSLQSSGGYILDTEEDKKAIHKVDTDINIDEGIPKRTASGRFITPLVRSIARAENISPQELDEIHGSGEAGRISRDDLIRYISERNKQQTGKTADQSEKHGSVDNNVPGSNENDRLEDTAHPAILSEGDRIIEMDRVRRSIARHMVASKHTSPHVTSFIDADVTNLVKWKNNLKDKITYTPVFIEAAAHALRDYPMVNVSVEKTNIIVRKNINIGMAVALPNGNLIVPVIRNADEKSLRGLARSVNDLADRARTGKLLPEEVSGGTFTVTNFGSFKNTTGTPIINQPQAAILGTGAIIKKPAVLETDQGDVIAIRHILTLSLSYDHRVVDGALGGMFLLRIAQYLESFDRERKI